MCACGSPSSHASATRPSSKRNDDLRRLDLRARRARSAAPRSAGASSPASSSCSTISGGASRRSAWPYVSRASRADHRAVEERLAAGRHLDRDAEPVLVRPQRAGVVGELGRQHRRDEPGHVGREGALGGAAVERRPGRHEVRDVGDVHPGADSVGLAAERERVVEVLRRLRVDRERRQLAQVDAAVELGSGSVVRLELDPRALLDEQRLEHVLDPRRAARARARPARARARAGRRRGRRARGRRAPSCRARSARPA